MRTVSVREDFGVLSMDTEFGSDTVLNAANDTDLRASVGSLYTVRMPNPAQNPGPRWIALGATGHRRRGPVLRIVMAAVAIVAFITAAIVGAVLLLALLAVFAAGATYLAVRVWWLRRRYRRNGSIPQDARSQPTTRSGTIIEGDYRHVEPRPRAE